MENICTKRILVIEDEPDVRDNIREILVLKDFDTITAENGLIGLQLARECRPDLIICDVMMPELNGYQVLEDLRQNSITANIPLIFLTAKTEHSDLRQGMELGADDYLTKPFRSDELVKAIWTRLKKQAYSEQKTQNQLNELRHNITSFLPHELLTPLNGIIGLSGILIDDYLSIPETEVKEHLNDIHVSGRRLYRLIQNFLLFANLELIVTNPERMQIWRNRSDRTLAKEAIASVAADIARQANRQNDLQLELLQDAIVKIAEQDLKKVVAEIVANAFKFSLVGNPVHLITNTDGNFLILCVINKGRGMTAEQISQIGAYMQFERKLYEQQGSGLGLIIAKRLTELYEGKFSINSIPHQQTIVRIALPLWNDGF